MKDDLRKELQASSPLQNLHGNDGFAPPHNYFREFPDQMLAKIHSVESASTIRPVWMQWIWSTRGAVALAAGLALIVVVCVFRKTGQTSAPFASISQHEAMEYVLNNLNEFSSDDLISAGILNDLDPAFFSPVGDESIDHLLEDEALMEEFLMN